MGVSVKRIVVTGMGIVSPLGCGVQHVWQSLLAGKSGITRLSEQLVADIPRKVAGRCRPLTAIRCTASTRWRPSPRKSAKDGSLLLSLRWSPRAKRWPEPVGRQHLRPNRNALPR
ncbi:hypothetical protein H7U16_16460 [Klebsiella pneumoniae]|uniref:Beta-ketoacyl synthase-like N-terminal domain-containing protein n=1 Tax=Klebsiella pneumoniae TaxID=573 RepID=A0A7X1LNT8_KLEPN|nr:hypothetical protein [Klebsiella pneumoniae]